MRAVGICLNTSGMEPEAARRLCDVTEDRLGLPCTDPIAFGVDPIIDSSYAPHPPRTARSLPADRARSGSPAATKTAADVVTVTISEGDAIGRGEAVPYPRYGESVESTLAAIERVRAADRAGRGPRARCWTRLPAGAARNAVDCALWDLEARLSGRERRGHDRRRRRLRPLASAMTIVHRHARAMARDAAMLADAPVLKIKVDASDPAAQIRAVRAAAPEADADRRSQ